MPWLRSKEKIKQQKRYSKSWFHGGENQLRTPGKRSCCHEQNDFLFVTPSSQIFGSYFVATVRLLKDLFVSCCVLLYSTWEEAGGGLAGGGSCSQDNDVGAEKLWALAKRSSLKLLLSSEPPKNIKVGNKQCARGSVAPGSPCWGGGGRTFGSWGLFSVSIEIKRNAKKKNKVKMQLLTLETSIFQSWQQSGNGVA